MPLHRWQRANVISAAQAEPVAHGAALGHAGIPGKPNSVVGNAALEFGAIDGTSNSAGVRLPSGEWRRSWFQSFTDGDSKVKQTGKEAHGDRTHEALQFALYRTRVKGPEPDLPGDSGDEAVSGIPLPFVADS